MVPRRGLLLGIGLILAFVLTGCAPSNELGPRPKGSALDAVEAYLQRFQPGPLPRVFQTTRIFSRDGTLLAERWQEGRRTWVGLEALAPLLIDATIATEDSTFFTNSGIDPARIAGAALKNAQEGQVVSGASTITMQLARNLVLGPDQRYEQSMDRKIEEAGLAQELTALFTKNELLEMYLNLNNYGHRSYGPEAAARVYFAKPASALTDGEATILAGITQAPAVLDPFLNFEAARSRQRVVLDLLVRHGYITQARSDEIFAEPIVLNPEPDKRLDLLPHFTQYVEDVVDARMGDGWGSRGGLQITGTVDLKMQQIAQDIVAKKVKELKPRNNMGNASLIALRPTTGDGFRPGAEVLAMVGSVNYNDDKIQGQVNVARSPRQPGSSIKPLLYATALNDNLISPATVMWDIPVRFTKEGAPSYTPRNYDGKFHGPVTVRYALANSFNIPAVKLLDAVTVPHMVDGTAKFGVKTLLAGRDTYWLALTLGGGEVTLLELTSAYAAFASGGRQALPEPILNVTDSLGRPVTQAVLGPAQAKQAVSSATAFQITDILSDNAARSPMFGTNSALKLSRPAAAKTGTTDDWRDNWTVGYTRYLVAGVWAGNTNGRPMNHATGITGAAPIWHEFMEAVIKDPELRGMLGAPEEAEAWRFVPPADVELRNSCPPGVKCRPDGSEYYSKAWLELAGRDGPLADTVVQVASAPVTAGGKYGGYCETADGLQRNILALPGQYGLPAGPQSARSEADARTEGLRAAAWSIRRSLPIDLGPCETVAAMARAAASADPSQGVGGLYVAAAMNRATDPKAGPAAAQVVVTKAQVASLEQEFAQAGTFRFVLAQTVTHHNSCPGKYIMGSVVNLQGKPTPGIRIALVDEWGNRAVAVSKNGQGDLGQYDFPLTSTPNRYTLTVVDEAGTPISPPVTFNHLQGSAAGSSCHTVVWGGE